MRYIASVTFTIESDFTDEDLEYAAEEGIGEEEFKQNQEELLLGEVIKKLEGKLDNSGYISNWSTDRVTINWEDD